MLLFIENVHLFGFREEKTKYFASVWYWSFGNQRNFMKRFAATCSFILIIFIGFGGSAEAKGKIKIPKECRTSNYTCVLKKNDGVPFFCVRTSKQRHENARKKIRIVSERNCIRRYPVEYETEGNIKTND
ncbi:hypothetical protein KJ966_16985 [bacterium]|nr:hypothetical protein [bacterium]